MAPKEPCNCEYCVPCQCGHRADEHVAGIGECFIPNCKCAIWMDKETYETFWQQQKKLNTIVNKD